MKSKEQLIKEYLDQPIQIGDPIDIQGLGSQDKRNWGRAHVHLVEGDEVVYESRNSFTFNRIKISDIRRSTSHIGPNPFKPEIRCNNIKITIEGLFFHIGYRQKEKQYKHEVVNGQQIPEICLSPMVVDSDGKEVEYQRGLVWNTEQKQLLIESIYNNIDIGKFVVRLRSWEWVEKRVNANQLQYTAFRDLVDGKQRTTALVEFVSNVFQDSNGLYFDDLSSVAQKHFLNYGNLQYNEMPESTKDSDVINYFLALNHTGTPMSKEHIEYVKSIRTL